MSRQVLGVSTEALEKYDVRFSKTFNMSESSLYAETLKFIKEKMGARILLRNLVKEKKIYIIAVGFRTHYKNCLDMTEVGFFFEKTVPDATRVDVVSLNNGLARFIADELFENECISLQECFARSKKGIFKIANDVKSQKENLKGTKLEHTWKYKQAETWALLTKNFSLKLKKITIPETIKNKKMLISPIKEVQLNSDKLYNAISRLEILRDFLEDMNRSNKDKKLHEEIVLL
ncbi:MAG: hypothetical protein U9Q21_02190, partial [Candidatus Auribacterota bacterium]|nr:hypothetical protein [Candidatus Auribacterota bacterium]